MLLCFLLSLKFLSVQEQPHALQSSRRHFWVCRFLRWAKDALELGIHLYCSINFFPLSSYAAFLQISTPQRAKDRLLQSDSSDLANLVEPALLNLQFMTAFLAYPYNISQREMETETVLTKQYSYCIPRATELLGSFSKAQGDHVTWHYFWHEHAGTICPSVSITNKHPAASFLPSGPLSVQRTYFRIKRRNNGLSYTNELMKFSLNWGHQPLVSFCLPWQWVICISAREVLFNL